MYLLLSCSHSPIFHLLYVSLSPQPRKSLDIHSLNTTSCPIRPLFLVKLPSQIHPLIPYCPFPLSVSLRHIFVHFFPIIYAFPRINLFFLPWNNWFCPEAFLHDLTSTITYLSWAKFTMLPKSHRYCRYSKEVQDPHLPYPVSCLISVFTEPYSFFLLSVSVT